MISHYPFSACLRQPERAQARLSPFEQLQRYRIETGGASILFVRNRASCRRPAIAPVIQMIRPTQRMSLSSPTASDIRSFLKGTGATSTRGCQTRPAQAAACHGRFASSEALSRAPPFLAFSKMPNLFGVTKSRICKLAFALHRSGRFAEAAKACRKIIKRKSEATNQTMSLPSSNAASFRLKPADTMPRAQRSNRRWRSMQTMRTRMPIAASCT